MPSSTPPSPVPAPCRDPLRGNYYLECAPVRRAVAIALLGLALATAGPVAARDSQAETILPPGQSAFTGPGRQSPHATDQLPLSAALTFKPEPLRAGPSVGTTPPRAAITLSRDAFGVPAISATNE